ncbi:hypothetical protein HWI92_22405 [Dyadobacter sandarakinus]|uniref:Uncharacterized protein n=1 Tax=Dyadobacter sandarakinus TaxID=2747268 RepID=A0ABX7IEQ2_9BACT|nr:hypothetical protein HWI92_22405 [Dyadobacter sandarakinus]
MSVPILLWIGVICYYSVNAPWYDDFDPFPDFLRKWIHARGVQEHLYLLFQPNNEHRMVVGKLVTLACYALTGHLNFTFLHLAGAGFTLGTLALVAKVFRRHDLPWWYFLPVVLLLFQVQYHLVFLWAICSLQHQPVIFFVCLSMYLLSKNRFSGALAAALCATFAMSNGIFVWVAGAAVLTLQASYRWLLVWLAAGAVAVACYFHGLTTMGNESSFAYFAQYPHLSVLGFFAFLGGLFDFFPEKPVFSRSVLPVIMGFAVMIWISIWLFGLVRPWFLSVFVKKNKESQVKNRNGNLSPSSGFLLGVLIFLLVNAFIIALLRPRFGFFVMIVSNYKMYPALFLIVAYLSLLFFSKNRKQTIFRGTLVIAAGIWLMSALNYLPVIAERSRYLTINAYNQEHHGFGLGHVPHSAGARYVDALMKDMVAGGIYQYPKAGNELGRLALRQAGTPPLADVQVIVRDSTIVMDEPAGSVSISRQTGQIAFLRADGKVYFFKMNPRLYAGRNFLRQYDRGFTVEIPLSIMQAGTYELGMLRLENGRSSGGIVRSIQVP